ncbi:hypothetical protein H711_00535, partial [Brucella ovis IntaBari-2009-88-3]
MSICALGRSWTRESVANGMRAERWRNGLDVSFQEVVHSERIEETGVTTPQFSRIAPNE